MKKRLLQSYLNRLGLDAVKRIVMESVSADADELLDSIKFKKPDLVDRILSQTQEENEKIAPIIMDNFGCYHQQIFLYKAEDQINLSELTDNIGNLTFPGYPGNELKYSHSEIQNDVIKILLFVPFKISYHIRQDGREERQNTMLHTPVLIKIVPEGIIISIMTFTKSEWTALLPAGIVDSLSHYNSGEMLDSIHRFIRRKICNVNLFPIDFTSKSIELLRMDEVDLYTATGIKNCESRISAIIDAFKKRVTLKESVPDKVDEILESPIITNIEIIFIESAFGLPEETRMVLFPRIGSIKISQHIEQGDLNEIQDYLFS